MKKIYTLSLACLLASSLLGQKIITDAPVKSAKVKLSSNYPYYSNFKKAGKLKGLTSFWSNDFSDPTDWAMSNTSVPSADWVVGTSGPANIMDPMTSTSGGNFALFDSDAPGAGSTQNAVLSLVSPINCTGKSTVILSFESFYTKYADSVFVEISNNNTTWTKFEVLDQSLPNVTSANPELVTLDITSVAANQALVYLRFRYQGAWDYAWMIDDIKFNEPSGNDLAVNGGYKGIFNVGIAEFGPYVILPLAQVPTSLTPVAEINNFGGSTITAGNAKAYAKLFTWYTPNLDSLELSNAADLAPYTSELAISANTFSPLVYLPDTTPGSIIFSTTADDIASNSKDTLSFLVSDSTLGHNFVTDNNSVVTSDSGSYIQFYDLENSDTLTSIDAAMYFRKLGSMIGTKHRFYVLDTNLSVIARTKYYTVTAQDTGFSNIKFYNFMLETPLILPSGSQFALAYFDTITGTNKISSVMLNGDYSSFGYTYYNRDATVDSNIYVQNDISWFMYANFGHSSTLVTSTNELSNEVRVLNAYPNPASDNLFVNVNSSAAIKLELVDALGQVVFQNIVSGNNTTHNINVSTLSSGMYFLKASNAQGTHTQKVNVK